MNRVHASWSRDINEPSHYLEANQILFRDIVDDMNITLQSSFCEYLAFRFSEALHSNIKVETQFGFYNM